jgi:uncharacterized protein YraI
MSHRYLPIQKGDVTMNSRLSIGLTLLAVLIAACVPASATPTPPPIVTEEPIIPVTGVAVVQSVEVQMLGINPIQVNAVIRGELPDAGCTTISTVDQMREGDTFHITLTTTTDPLALCAQALTPFEEVVRLDTTNLPPAPYVVNANSIQQAFELLPRDMENFKQMLVQALNAKDYETLRLMMDKSLTIAHWRSQGNAYDVETSLEQLKSNHLSANTSITADFAKDLTTLPDGTDPFSVFRLDVGPNHMLFVSGWGPEGKAEAILYMNYLLDGSLYWHSVLVAKDGFAEKLVIAPVTVPPVDMNAYPTNVKYVLAQKDVRMRNGPGTQFSIIGWVAAGQTAKVTGVNFNGSWWRVICPDDRVGSCWVSADHSLTKTTDGIVTNPPADPTKKADVQSVEIQVLESYPLQVKAIARGLLPDSGCTTITNVSQSRNGNVFTVVVTMKTNQQVVCAQMLTPFEQVISLDVSSLLPGTYIVHVNGVEASFSLPESHQPTNVTYVMAQQDVSIYDGPSSIQYNVIGFVVSGQIAKVTGTSADGNWWRVTCPDDTVGSCWVTADPTYSQPTQQP